MAVRAVPVLTALTLTAALTLAGCTADPPPSQSAPTTPASTSSTTPTPTAPSSTTSVDPVLAKIPPAARPNTQAGAEAFARFFYGQVSQSWTEADPTLIEGLYQESCKSCRAFRDTAVYLQQHNRRYANAPIEIVRTSVSASVPAKTIIAVEADVKAGRIVDDTGATLEAVTAQGKQRFFLTLSYNARWRVQLSQVATK